jgi:hypothetical protein
MATPCEWTAIGVSWSSILADVARYVRERLLRWQIAALWVLLVLALVVASPGWPPAGLAAAAGFLAVAVAVLRLWDDLADLGHDRIVHPARVLVAAGDVRLFAVLVGIGLLLLAGWCAGDVRRVALYASLLAVLAVLYHSRPGQQLGRTLRACLVLVKYPVLVLLAGAAPSGRTWLTGLLLYAVLGIYEWRSDGELRVAPLNQVLLGGVSGLALISIVFVTAGARP